MSIIYHVSRDSRLPNNSVVHTDYDTARKDLLCSACTLQVTAWQGYISSDFGGYYYISLDTAKALIADLGMVESKTWSGSHYRMPSKEVAS